MLPVACGQVAIVRPHRGETVCGGVMHAGVRHVRALAVHAVVRPVRAHFNRHKIAGGSLRHRAAEAAGRGGGHRVMETGETGGLGLAQL
jgi:hypothetical protein